jgi:hypothetical protein
LCQKVVTVWPPQNWPDASVTVPLMIMVRVHRAVEVLVDGKQCRLGIERVENRLDHQHVVAALTSASVCS